jgi:hypothetical protein
MARYSAHISGREPMKYGDVTSAIGVLESPVNPMPIGEATCRDRTDDGLGIWTLRIGETEIPGRWVIVDREFRPA